MRIHRETSDTFRTFASKVRLSLESACCSQSYTDKNSHPLFCRKDSEEHMAVNRAAQGGGRRGGSFANGHHHSATNGHDAYCDLGSPKEKKTPFWMARRKRLRCLAFVAIVGGLVLFIAVPRVLLDRCVPDFSSADSSCRRSSFPTLQCSSRVIVVSALPPCCFRFSSDFSL